MSQIPNTTTGLQLLVFSLTAKHKNKAVVSSTAATEMVYTCPEWCLSYINICSAERCCACCTLISDYFLRSTESQCNWLVIIGFCWRGTLIQGLSLMFGFVRVVSESTIFSLFKTLIYCSFIVPWKLETLAAATSAENALICSQWAETKSPGYESPGNSSRCGILINSTVCNWHTNISYMLWHVTTSNIFTFLVLF